MSTAANGITSDLANLEDGEIVWVAAQTGSEELLFLMEPSKGNLTHRQGRLHRASAGSETWPSRSFRAPAGIRS